MGHAGAASAAPGFGQHGVGRLLDPGSGGPSMPGCRWMRARPVSAIRFVDSASKLGPTIHAQEPETHQEGRDGLLHRASRANRTRWPGTGPAGVAESWFATRAELTPSIGRATSV